MDLIDRQRLKDDIAVLFERNEKLIDEWLANCVDDVIDEQPSADVPDRKVGKWKMNSNYPDMLVCSECDGHFDCWHWEIAEMHYCPSCGARMKGEE